MTPNMPCSFEISGFASFSSGTVHRSFPCSATRNAQALEKLNASTQTHTVPSNGRAKKRSTSQSQESRADCSRTNSWIRSL